MTGPVDKSTFSLINFYTEIEQPKFTVSNSCGWVEKLKEPQLIPRLCLTDGFVRRMYGCAL